MHWLQSPDWSLPTFVTSPQWSLSLPCSIHSRHWPFPVLLSYWLFSMISLTSAASFSLTALSPGLISPCLFCHHSGLISMSPPKWDVPLKSRLVLTLLSLSHCILWLLLGLILIWNYFIYLFTCLFSDYFRERVSSLKAETSSALDMLLPYIQYSNGLSLNIYWLHEYQCAARRLWIINDKYYSPFDSLVHSFINHSRHIFNCFIRMLNFQVESSE